MATLFDLPEELRCQIAGYLSLQDLMRLKDTCRALRPSAMRELMAKVRVYPSKKKVRRYLGLLSHPVLSKSVRHLELNTLGPRWEQNEYESEKWDGATLDNNLLFYPKVTLSNSHVRA